MAATFSKTIMEMRNGSGSIVPFMAVIGCASQSRADDFSHLRTRGGIIDAS